MANTQQSFQQAGGSQSTMTGNFSSDLNEAFSMDKDLNGLVQSVEQKKQVVSSQNQELEALEARLKEADEKLKQKKMSSPSKVSRSSVSQGGQPSGDVVTAQGWTRTSGEQSESNQPPPRSGPATGQAPMQSTMAYWKPEMPGGLPDTPAEGFQGDYMATTHQNNT